MPHSGMDQNLVLLNAVNSKYNSVKDGKLFTDASIISRLFSGKTVCRVPLETSFVFSTGT
jgi:hypothetical protein